ncbi:MAG: hypothetical protein ABIS92_10835 [Polyangia bacterium]
MTTNRVNSYNSLAPAVGGWLRGRLLPLLVLSAGSLLMPAVALADPHDNDHHDEGRGRDQDHGHDGDHRDNKDRMDGRHDGDHDRGRGHEDRDGDGNRRRPGPPPAMQVSPPLPSAQPAPGHPFQPAPRPGVPFMRGTPPGGSGAGPAGAPIMRGLPPTAPRAAYPRFAPPPPRHERPPVRAGYTWAPGYYDWADDRYVWVNGHYETERPDAYWNPPRWELRAGAFTWLPGGWTSIQSEPVVAPPPPPREVVTEVRPGFTWIVGYYEWRGSSYVWVPGRWEQERRDERWFSGHWERHGHHWLWRHGGWHRR